MARLGEVCDMDRKGIRPDDPVASRLPFVGVEHIQGDTGIINLDSATRIGSQKSTAFRFDERHILYGKLRPYLNKVATPDFAGRCSTELVPLLPREGVDRQFLAHVLRRKTTVDFVMKSVTGSRMPRTDMKALMSMPFPLPTFGEQRRIVAILNRAARIERLRVHAADRMREFITALFVKMFGDPAENPMGWKTPQLGDLCLHAQYGTSRKADGNSDGTPMLRMGNVSYEGALDCTSLKHAALDRDELDKYRLQTGDILFNRTNSKDLVGKTGLWDGRFEAVAASYFIVLRVDESILSPVFLWAFMNSNSMKRHFRATARGAIGQSNINAKEVKSIITPLPPLDRQQRFAELVERALGIIGRSRSAESAALSASLLNQLLSDGRQQPRACENDRTRPTAAEPA